MTTNHVPRRSGNGMRQVFTPKPAKVRRRRWRPAGPALCNAVHPERPGIVDGQTGAQLVDPVTCRRMLDHDELGRLVPHKGEHRARPLRGIAERWTGAEAVR